MKNPELSGWLNKPIKDNEQTFEDPITDIIKGVEDEKKKRDSQNKNSKKGKKGAAQKKGTDKKK